MGIRCPKISLDEVCDEHGAYPYENNLAQMRRKQGLSQRQLASLSGFKSHKEILEVEQGKRDVHLLKALRIVGILGTTLPRVFFGSFGGSRGVHPADAEAETGGKDDPGTVSRDP